MHFQKLSLSKALLRALADEGYEHPTPIQEQAIPVAMARKDVLATAQTGTGKTAAFALPILELLGTQSSGGASRIKALVLAPTRELALQIDASFRRYGRHLRLRTAVVLGGVSPAPQIKALRYADIVVATPGRLLDLWRSRHADLTKIEMLVLDEADRMLDMGFAPDVRRIVAALPPERQTMMFSATLTPEIAGLAKDMLKTPSIVTATPPASVSGNIMQRVMFVEQMNKCRLLTEIVNQKNTRRVLVFTRTKRGADKVARQLVNDRIAADVIHSNKSQGARQRALGAFDRGKIKVLVATDIASRGIDVEGISHVINYEMPDDPKSYVHRIGRTARAGSTGTAVSLCNADEISLLRGIEKFTQCCLVAVEDQPFHSPAIASRRNRNASMAAPSPTLHRRRKGTQRPRRNPLKPAAPRFSTLPAGKSRNKDARMSAHESTSRAH
jgi:ATP-dependent RNA helicase RhlE